MIRKHILRELANRFFTSLAFSAMVAPVLRLLGARVGAGTRMYSPLILHNTNFRNLVIGSECHIGRNVFMDLEEEIHLSDRVTVSMNTTIVTHTDIGAVRRLSEFPPSSAPVRIGSNTYVGAGVILLQGVTIGEGCVVAAGAVVTADVPPNCLVAGIPAQVVRRLSPIDSPSVEA